jgi:putative transposase
MLQSSYAQVINGERNEFGSLFKQKAKAKLIDGNLYHIVNYIHQNPVKAGIATSLADWPYSSYKDLAGLRNGSICNKDLIFKLLDVSQVEFSNRNLWDLDDEIIKGFY